MTMTPWGESEELRRRKLPPGPGVSREEVERNHRERLYGATVAVVAAKGYPSATIADLTDVASISRSTFYQYFATKEECFLATLEPILAGVVAVTKGSLEGEAPLRERVETGMGAFIRLLVAHPDAARLCVVEAEAAGSKAIAMVDAAAAEFAEIVVAVFERLPEQRGMPREIVDAMVGGMRKLVQTRLLRRTETELLELVPELVRLGLSYRPPPRPFPDRTRRGNNTPAIENGLGVDEPAQRLELAAMTVIARDGYTDSTMAAIAREARVSVRTLYANFDDKADLFESILLRCHLSMSAATIPSFRRAVSWPEGVAALVRAAFAFLEAESDFTHLITFDVYGAGAEALASRDRALDAMRRFIERTPAGPGRPDPIIAEAIQSALYSMIVSRVRSRHKNLRGMAPLAIYMILSPSLGPEAAYHYAVA